LMKQKRLPHVLKILWQRWGGYIRRAGTNSASHRMEIIFDRTFSAFTGYFPHPAKLFFQIQVPLIP
jgi:hypothetical protein